MIRSISCSTLLLGAVLAGCVAPPEPADLVLLGGKIVTVDPSRPEAEALAARDGRIVAVGSDDEVRAHVGDRTRVIELAGRLAVPGFIESHGHFTGVGRNRMVIDLRGATTWEEIVDIVAAAAETTPPGEWIVGWGWHQDKWTSPPEPSIDGYPLHESLSRLTPEHPVLLKHAAGGHAGFANARTLELAGIDETTPDPPGGQIVRGPNGRATGLLREAAMARVNALFLASRTTEEIARREIEIADEECLSKGITTFQDAGSRFDVVDRLRAMAEAGEVDVRLWVMLSDAIGVDDLVERAAGYRVIGAADDHFTVRAIKREVDGALGSHTAWLIEPYSDVPDESGINTTPMEEIERAAEFAIANDFQICAHAIGDRSNREMLDLYERIFERRGGKGDRRWRIEHAQHLAPEDIPRFAELGVIAAMQGVHCTSDGPWVPERLGPERSAEGAYVWRKLIDSGAVVANGTDAPIEDVDPIASFYSSITRRMSNGELFYPEQKMTRMEALRSYTIDAAYAAFEEEQKGSLTPGKLADVAVLSRDIMSVPEDEISDARVLYTIIGGEVVFEREEES
jgi:predicted amidohydrolase YtcJ